MDLASNCICLRWVTDDGIDRTLRAYQYSEEKMEVGEWYGCVSFSDIRSVDHILR